MFIASDSEENKVSFQTPDLRHSNQIMMRLSGTSLSGTRIGGIRAYADLS